MWTCTPLNIRIVTNMPTGMRAHTHAHNRARLTVVEDELPGPADGRVEPDVVELDARLERGPVERQTLRLTALRMS